ncbi:MAG: 30S ribosomal protein S20 [Candidatus Methylomirabilales bacterium]
MPIIKSSEKDLRRTARRAQVNRAAKGKLRSSLKKVRAAVEENQADAAKAALAAATPVIDRAVSKGVLHKNAAARHKSRLMRRLNKLTPPASA